MGSITFAVPIQPGKTEEWKRAVEEIKGARSTEHNASRRRVGITREFACLQQTPQGDFTVVLIESDGDPAEAIEKLLSSDEPFDRWFLDRVIKEAHGLDPSEGPPPSEPMLDWRA